MKKCWHEHHYLIADGSCQCGLIPKGLNLKTLIQRFPVKGVKLVS